RASTANPNLIPPQPWYLRPLVWHNQMGGWAEFTFDGLWFTPNRYLQRLLGLQRQLVVAWADVLAVDFHPNRLTVAPMAVYRRDRSYLRIGSVGARAAQKLVELGFEPHSRPSWPDRRLWTRLFDPPDWSLLHNS